MPKHVSAKRQRVDEQVKVDDSVPSAAGHDEDGGSESEHGRRVVVADMATATRPNSQAHPQGDSEDMAFSEFLGTKGPVPLEPAITRDQFSRATRAGRGQSWIFPAI